ncbi:MAG TPA: MFS transporter [Candidatus Dormibacteraeota bacterium]|jgi:CP family cyanate transporter-like MFS transporter
MSLTGTLLFRLGLLWLVGNCVRLTLLAVPPLLPLIHHSLPLNESAIGALSSLPILLLATATLLGSLLISRIGARRAVLLGLLLIAAGGAFRGVGPSLAVIFAMTILMGVGIAIVQPSMPSLVALWLPRRVGIATAAFSNGFLIGEILPAALTVPWVLTLVGGSWEWALAFWSLPVAFAALAVLFFTGHEARAAGEPRPLWIPDWRDPTTLRLGITLGAASAIYFGLNAFIPDYMRATHHPELITPALTCLNLFQLPASFVVGGLSQLVLGRRWPFIATGLLTLAAIGAFIVLPGIWQAIAVGVVGYAAAQVFMLVLALPPLLAEADDVHRLTAGITTVQYTIGFLAPVVAGVLWDLTGSSSSAYWMVIVAAAVQTVVPIGLRLPSHTRTQAA